MNHNDKVKYNQLVLDDINSVKQRMAQADAGDGAQLKLMQGALDRASDLLCALIRERAAEPAVSKCYVELMGEIHSFNEQNGGDLQIMEIDAAEGALGALAGANNGTVSCCAIA